MRYIPNYYLMDILSGLIIAGNLQKILDGIHTWFDACCLSNVFPKYSLMEFYINICFDACCQIYLQISFDGYSRWFDYC